MRLIAFFAVILLINVSCSQNNVNISGNFACFADDQLIILETIVGGQSQHIDSTYTKKGDFKFKIDPAPATPTIYNIRHENQIIPLLVARGENIKISSVGNISKNYRVEGSEGSTLVKEISLIMNSGAASLDSLSKIYISASNDEQLKKQVAREYSDQYFKIKREQLAFIISNKGSLAAVYALFQRLPNDEILFNGETDVVYLQLVADSIAVNYPESPYLMSLQNEIRKMNSVKSTEQLKQTAVDAPTRNYPDIILPDMYGKTQKLSDLEGKVVLIDFWLAESPQCRLDNAELLETYNKYAAQGFEIYQVGLDKSKSVWITTIQDQKLPWISVCDFMGEKTTPVSLYNVTKVPSSFLLDKQGNIVSRDLRGDALEAQIRKLL